MKLCSALSFVLVLAAAAVEARRDRSVSGILKKYHWQKHLLMVFSNKALNQKYLHQKKILKELEPELARRDIIVGHFLTGKSWTEDFRAYFNIPKRLKFAVILLTKDGLVKFKTRRIAQLSTDVFPIVDRVPSLFKVPPRFALRRRRRNQLAKARRERQQRTTRSWVV